MLDMTCEMDITLDFTANTIVAIALDILSGHRGVNVMSVAMSKKKSQKIKNIRGHTLLTSHPNIRRGG